MVPVCNMTSSNVIGGDDGSRPSSFSVTTTCAELENGNSSARPCTIASTMTFSSGIRLSSGLDAGSGGEKGRHLNRGPHEITHLAPRCALTSGVERNFVGWFNRGPHEITHLAPRCALTSG